MRLLSLAVVCALVPVVPAAAMAQDERRVVPGVTAAGIDLSGLTVAEVQARLDAELAPRVAPDLVLGVAGRPWTLTMADAKLKLDTALTAKRALYADAAGPVAPALSHSRLAVRAFVEGIARRVRRAPRDAAIRITLRKIHRTRSRRGRALPVQDTAGMVDAALDDPAAPRVLHRALTEVRPKVTADRLADVYGTVITIDRASFKLRLFKRLKWRKTYGVAVGQVAYPTPAGRFSISGKQVNPTWSVPNSPWAGELAGTSVVGGSAANPLKARWMGIANGVGIHGTGEEWSIGSRASHGCIRMRVADVIDLFSRVPVGTPVLIK